MTLNLAAIRAQFPALSRQVGSRPVTYLDGPAGSQVPECVIAAVADCLRWHNANRGAPFASSQEADALLEKAHVALADFVGTSDPGEIAFGANMTSLTLALSRAVARGWRPGDEILVSRLDHDANFSPWVLAARDAGCVVREIPVRLPEGTLDLDRYAELLGERTRLVAVGLASNLTGTVNPVREVVAAARRVGAMTFVDAVHYAPHGLMDVRALDCDFLACSAYKFFGPHVGVLWGRRELLQSIEPYKLRPAPDMLPGRWMTGTQNHEGIAGTAAAVEYLARLPGLRFDAGASRRERLQQAWSAIAEYEAALVEPLLRFFVDRGDFQLWGLPTVSWGPHRRVPTVSVTHRHLKPRELAERLAEQGFWTWAGNHYALPFTEAAGLEPHGTWRIGLLHYNTAEEVTRLIAAISAAC